MTDEYTLTIHPFEMGTNKDAALKPLEEASEVYSAWQTMDMWYRAVNPEPVSETIIMPRRTHLADELADVVQAACNLAARYDIDLSAAMERCERRNRERGRYRSPQPEMTEGARAILDRMMEGANDE